MKILKAPTKEEAARLAADLFEAVIRENPNCVLGLATGSSPIPLYQELISREKAGKIDFSAVRCQIGVMFIICCFAHTLITSFNY